MASEKDILAGTHGRCAYCRKVLTFLKQRGNVARRQPRVLRKHNCANDRRSHGKLAGAEAREYRND
jgi:hypothetical protein